MWRDLLVLWDGNPVKLDCDDHYTTTDVIKKKEKKNILETFSLTSMFLNESI